MTEGIGHTGHSVASFLQLGATGLRGNSGDPNQSTETADTERPDIAGSQFIIDAGFDDGTSDNDQGDSGNNRNNFGVNSENEDSQGLGGLVEGRTLTIAQQIGAEGGQGGENSSEGGAGSSLAIEDGESGDETGGNVGLASLGAEEGGDGEENPSGLTDAEEKTVAELKKIDAETRRHEAAHAAVGGQYAGSPSYSYQSGPDGRQYAVGGEVSIDTSPIKGDPDATILKMQQVRAAALAPAEPSAQDQKVAAAAQAAAGAARAEKAAQAAEERQAEASGEGDESGQAEGEQQNSTEGVSESSNISENGEALANGENGNRQSGSDRNSSGIAVNAIDAPVGRIGEVNTSDSGPFAVAPTQGSNQGDGQSSDVSNDVGVFEPASTNEVRDDSDEDDAADETSSFEPTRTPSSRNSPYDFGPANSNLAPGAAGALPQIISITV